MSNWQVQEAKADLSALIRAAEAEGPQTITRHGETVAIVMSVVDYDQLKRSSEARRGSLIDFFAAWPPLELPERDQLDIGREVDL